MESILLFHKPVPEEYAYIKALAIKGGFRSFGLIALSRYRKTEDIELIKAGFKDVDNSWIGSSYFLSIENFPDKSFKPLLIEHRTKIT
jgi:hypothetical protein